MAPLGRRAGTQVTHAPPLQACALHAVPASHAPCAPQACPATRPALPPRRHPRCSLNLGGLEEVGAQHALRLPIVTAAGAHLADLSLSLRFFHSRSPGKALCDFHLKKAAMRCRSAGRRAPAARAWLPGCRGNGTQGGRCSPGRTRPALRCTRFAGRQRDLEGREFLDQALIDAGPTQAGAYTGPRRRGRQRWLRGAGTHHRGCAQTACSSRGLA